MKLALSQIGFVALWLGVVYMLCGCTSVSTRIKVIKSNGEIQITQPQINDGDILVCDTAGCKVLRQ